MTDNTFNTNIEKIKNDIAEIGDNLSLMYTIAKSIEIALEDNFNFDKSDIENLLSALKKFIADAQENYNKIDEILIL